MLTITKSALQVADIIEAPSVPAANINGLLPIDALEKPVVVELKVWPSAKPKYTYTLLWNGIRIPPEKEILESDRPGDRLNLEIPVDLQVEGIHEVAYVIYSPFSNTSENSLPTTIQIDRTAPGAPQLAPIIFPDLIQSGLTSSELEGLNNVLPGKIASYGGIAVGDEIRTYWGNLEGPVTFVDADDMGLNRVMVDFPRALLEQVGDVEASVHYTVTDQAGNLSMPSDAVSVTLELSVITPLPTPTIKEATADTLDPAAALNGATVVIDVSASLNAGDKVDAYWIAPKGSDHKEIIVTPEHVNSPIEVIFAAALVSVNDGQTVEVSYSVTRTSGIVQASPVLQLNVLSSALELPAPTMDTVGADGILRPSLIPESGATVRVGYRDMKTGDNVLLRWTGASAADAVVQTVGSETQLLFTLPRALIVASEGGTASVQYFVNRDGVDRDSEVLALTVKSGLELDTSSVILGGKVYLLPGTPDLLPAFPTGTTVKRVASGGQPPYAYSSSDPKIAHVDGEGLVSVRKVGAAVITATDASGESKAYNVSVTGVIECSGVGFGNLTQIANAANAAQMRLPTIHELVEIYNAYAGRWPMGNGNYWSSTVAKDVFGAKWYYVKDLSTGKDYKLLHINGALGVALR
jgi:hypothetical protein